MIYIYTQKYEGTHKYNIVRKKPENTVGYII